MGTDIHMVVQFRRNGHWGTVGGRRYRTRHYDVFGMLADVRNGSGFAGVDTGNGFTPIATPPRGFPDGFTTDEDDHEGVWMGDHSFSWVTLRELLDYTWEKTTEHRGYINVLSQFDTWDKERSCPQSWCGMISGLSVRHLTHEEARALVRGDAKPEDGLHYTTQVSWTETYKESAGEFYSKFIPELVSEAQAMDVSADDVRLVFGFDS